MEAIVLAGGLGTRLQGVLQGVPKPMAPIGGRPFLDILLSQLVRCGCGRVILSVGHLHSVIEEYFGVAWRGMTLDYVIENEPLGTGGAVRAAMAEGREESLLVLNGDSYIQIDYAAMTCFHSAQSAQMSIAVTHQPDVARYGDVLLDGDRVVGFEEKGRTGAGWINAGVYVIRRDLEWPPELSGKFSFETDFLVPGIARLRPAPYKVDGLFIDIGIPEDLARAQTELAELDV